MPIKKILVTGSSGTIGTRLCERLLESGNYEVTGVDIKGNKWSPKIDKLTKIMDLTKKAEVAKLESDFDLVIHLAAHARVYNLVLKPEEALENIAMTFNVLEHCREHGIKRVMFASSREIYGNAKKTVFEENDARIDNAESPYSASKVSGEALVRSYHNCYRMDFIITRFSNVYGMYDESDRLMPLSIKLCRQGREIVVFGEEKELDFTYIDDTIDGIMKCVENFDKVKNQAFNIASGNAVFILDIVERIKKKLNSNSKITVGQNRAGEVVKFTADISRAGKLLGYSPKYSLEEGLGKTVEWYRRNRSI